MKSPRLTEWASTCARSARAVGRQRRQSRVVGDRIAHRRLDTVAFDRRCTRSASSASSPNPSRARRTTTCSPSPGAPSRSASAPSSAATTTWRWARARRRRAARADRRVDHARRPGPRHVDDPPRHARHVGDVPPPRRAGDHRRQRRPDVRRSRRARPRRRVVRGASTRRTASRSRRSASASTVSRSSWRSSPDCGRPARRALRLRRRARGSCTDSPALPKPVQHAGCRSSSAAAGRRRTPALAARFATEFNLPFGPIERFRRAAATRGRRRARRSDRDPATLDVLRGRSSLCRRRRRGRRRRAGRRRSAASPTSSAPDGRRRHARRGGRNAANAGRRPAPSGCTSRSSTSPISTISTLVAATAQLN